ncbi:MAG: hypothetical protein U0271_05270 [Polyangiaceae bacterium]
MTVRNQAASALLAAVVASTSSCAPAPAPNERPHASSVAAAEPTSTTSAAVAPTASAVEPASPPRTRSWRVAHGVDGSFTLDMTARPEGLALFPDDAIECDRASTRQASCTATSSSGIRVGDDVLLALRFEDRWEHEGMFGVRASVALAYAVADEPPEVVAELADWRIDCFDCGTTIAMRRLYVARDATGPLVCIESVEESGVGLFDVLDLEQLQQPWVPLARSRSFRAFHWNVSQRKLVEASAAPCPKVGYGPFAPLGATDPLLDVRAKIQGDAQTQPCPAQLFGGCMVEACVGKSQPKP